MLFKLWNTGESEKGLYQRGLGRNSNNSDRGEIKICAWRYSKLIFYENDYIDGKLADVNYRLHKIPSAYRFKAAHRYTC